MLASALPCSAPPYQGTSTAPAWSSHGIRTGPADVLEAVLRGDAVGADAYYFRVVVTVETSAPRFAHLQDSLLVAAAARGADRVVYDAYRVR